jgi:hypothetical protein
VRDATIYKILQKISDRGAFEAVIIVRPEK